MVWRGRRLVQVTREIIHETCPENCPWSQRYPRDKPCKHRVQHRGECRVCGSMWINSQRTALDAAIMGHERQHPDWAG